MGVNFLRNDFWDSVGWASVNRVNRPFPNSPGPLFQNEGRCSAFDMEIIFHSHANKGFLELGGGLLLVTWIFSFIVALNAIDHS